MASRELVPFRTAVSTRRNAPVRRDASIRPTQETYDALQNAYDYFNGRLFDDSLPNCVITLKRHGRSYGFFCGDRFARTDGLECDEIAMNPMYFRDRPLAETLSTLVHEMVHLWQHRHGTPGRGGYHNRQWAETMKRVGLYPSDSAAPGGKETGDRVSHYIMEGGHFAKAMAGLARRGFAIPWSEVLVIQQQNVPSEPESVPPPAPKAGKRVRYTCSHCGLNAWAMHGAELACLQHGVQMLPSK